MSLELDHVFICSEEAPNAERALADFGLTFGRRGVHRGQGTANACAFFDNAYFELLWQNNEEELRSEQVRPLALWERIRWRQTGASPFGIAFRSREGAQGTMCVETWPYAAPFLPVGAQIPIVTPRHVTREPLIFLSLISQAPATLPVEHRPPLEHQGRRRWLTGATVSRPYTSPLSSGLRTLCDLGLLAMKEAAEHHLELEWDSASSGECHDFRPAVPLLLRW